MVHKTVYLAGPIDGLSYAEGIEWRQHAQKDLAVHGIKGMSPQRGKGYIADFAEIAGEMDFSKQEGLTDNPMSTSRGILARDKFDALNCSVLFVSFLGATRVSTGTIMEIAWAYQLNKPIVVVVEDDDTLHRNHPMLRETFDYVVNNIDAGLDIVKGIFEGY